MNDIRGMIWFQFCFVILHVNTPCFSVPVIQHDGKVTEKIFLSATPNVMAAWVCFKIYNHFVSPESKKYSKHEIKTRSSV